MAGDKEALNPLEQIWKTLTERGGDLLTVITDPLDSLSPTGKKLAGLFNDYFGGKIETLSEFRDNNPAPSDPAPLIHSSPQAPEAPTNQETLDSISNMMPPEVSAAAMQAVTFASTSVSGVAGTMLNVSAAALNTFAAATNGKGVTQQQETAPKSAGAHSFP